MASTSNQLGSRTKGNVAGHRKLGDSATHENDKNRTTLAIVFHRFGPYHRVRIESVADDFDVVGVELSKQTQEYAWDSIQLNEHCQHVVVCDGEDSRSLKMSNLFQKIDATLKPLKPDAVAINGWSDNGAFATLRWCQIHQVPAIVMSESNQSDFARNPVREFIKRRIVSCFSAALAGGSLARDYLVSLGLPEHLVSTGYDIVDNQHFSSPNDFDAVQFRQQVGLQNAYFLASNRFIEKKNLPRLIEAFSIYRKQVRREPSDELAWDLVLLGDGPQKDELLRLVKSLGVESHVHFPGFLQYNELPKYYWGAKAFIHSSTTEQWGLVINEAMAAGLPVIASSRCGSTADLVVEGKTGFVFDPLDVPTLADRMLKLAQDPVLRERMSVEAKRHIADWGPERFATGMRNAVDAALSRPAQPNWLDRLTLRMLCR